MIRISQSGAVSGPADIFVSADVRVEFRTVPDSAGLGYAPMASVALGFASVSTGAPVPVPPGIRVSTWEGYAIEPWTPDVYLLLLGRAYSVWMGEERLFETEAEVRREIQVPVVHHRVSSLSPALGRMSI